jgi:hypothetical protein
VEAELLLDLAEDLLAGLVQADPDEAVAMAERLLDVTNRQVGNALAGGIGGAVYDPGGMDFFMDVRHDPPDIIAGLSGSESGRVRSG